MISDVKNGNFPFLIVSSEKMSSFYWVSPFNTIGNLKIFCSVHCYFRWIVISDGMDQSWWHSWYPGYQSQKIIKRKNKEGKKVGSGQMVTSIVGIDQWEAYIPDRVYRFCENWLDSVSHMTRLRLWSEKLIQTVVIKFAFTTMANVLRGAELWRTGKLFSKDRSLTLQQFETITSWSLKSRCCLQLSFHSPSELGWRFRPSWG